MEKKSSEIFQKIVILQKNIYDDYITVFDGKASGVAVTHLLTNKKGKQDLMSLVSKCVYQENFQGGLSNTDFLNVANSVMHRGPDQGAI